MKRLFILLVVGLGLAQAQLELEAVNVLRDFSDLLQNACDQLGGVGGVLENIPVGLEVPEELTWLCATVPSIDRAATMAAGFLNDINGFFSQTMNDSFSQLAKTIGWQIGNTNLQTIINDSAATLEGGIFSATGLTGQVLSKANQAQLQRMDDPAPPGASETEQQITESLQRTPGYVSLELQNMNQRDTALMRNAQATDVVQDAQHLTATALARGDEQQLLLRVTNPAHAAGGQGGTADEAEDAGFAAVSSRAALQAMVTAQADSMRQDAVATANLTQALKEQAALHSYTAQELGLVVESLTEQNLQAYQKQETAYYKEIAQVTAEANGVRDNLFAVAILLDEEVELPEDAAGSESE
jgi:hypothetical protein